MLKRIAILAFLFPLLALAGCAAPKAKLKNNPNLKKVAIISLAVSDWGGSVNANSIGSESVRTLVQNATGKMLTFTERELANFWQVKRVDSFITDSQYRKAAADIRVSVHSPRVNGKEMPLFGAGFKRGDITPEKAKNLCKTLGVDAVVLVFSEWTTATGGMVPITKARSKNVVAFWDKRGEKIYFRRIDVQGRKPIGAFNIKAVNRETIEQWTDGYEEALRKMFASL
jgi:hypothetical protein